MFENVKIFSLIYTVKKINKFSVIHEQVIISRPDEGEKEKKKNN